MSSDINCQNLGNQINGYHNSANITDIRPSSSDGLDPGDDGHNGHNDQVSSPSGSNPSGSNPSGYIPSGNPITGARSLSFLKINIDYKNYVSIKEVKEF